MKTKVNRFPDELKLKVCLILNLLTCLFSYQLKNSQLKF